MFGLNLNIMKNTHPKVRSIKNIIKKKGSILIAMCRACEIIYVCGDY
jgi:hypothetical protein